MSWQFESATRSRIELASCDKIPEEEQEFYKLLPANNLKTDLLYQLWQSCSNLHKIQTVYDIAETPQKIRLSKKRPHGISAACETICIPRL